VFDVISTGAKEIELSIVSNFFHQLDLFFRKRMENFYADFFNPEQSVLILTITTLTSPQTKMTRHKYFHIIMTNPKENPEIKYVAIIHR